LGVALAQNVACDPLTALGKFAGIGGLGVTRAFFISSLRLGFLIGFVLLKPALRSILHTVITEISIVVGWIPPSLAQTGVRKHIVYTKVCSRNVRAIEKKGPFQVSRFAKPKD
jgi:hypothetical protein